MHLFIHCRMKGFAKQEKNIQKKKTLKKNREDSFEVQLNTNSEGRGCSCNEECMMKCQRLATNYANTNKVAWVGLGYLIYL